MILQSEKTIVWQFKEKGKQEYTFRRFKIICIWKDKTIHIGLIYEN